MDLKSADDPSLTDEGRWFPGSPLPAAPVQIIDVPQRAQTMLDDGMQVRSSAAPSENGVGPPASLAMFGTAGGISNVSVPRDGSVSGDRGVRVAQEPDIYDVIEADNTAMERVTRSKARDIANSTPTHSSNHSIIGRGILKRGKSSRRPGSDSVRAGFSDVKSVSRFDPDEPPRSYLQSREESMLGEGSVAASPGTMLGRHLGRLNFPSHHQKGSSPSRQSEVSAIQTPGDPQPGPWQRAPSSVGSRFSVRRFMTGSRMGSFKRASGMDDDDQDSNLFFDRVYCANPQEKRLFPSAHLVRVLAVANAGLGVLYLHWRYTSTFPPTIDRWDYMSWKLYWWWLFFSAEFFLAIAVWVGLAQRLFPVQRIKVTMDDITSVDDQVGYNARVCILLPTAGENLEVVFKALVGALSQRLWDSGLPGSQTLRVIVLDEKRRLEVYRVAAGVHRIGELLAGRRIQQILMAEGVTELTPKGFIDWCRNGSGYERKHLYDDKKLNEAVQVLRLLDAMCLANGLTDAFALEARPSSATYNPVTAAAWNAAAQAQKSNKPSVEAVAQTSDAARSEAEAKMLGASAMNITPGFFEIYGTHLDPDNMETSKEVQKGLPTLIYFSRKNAGTPKISPKAGNMNAAIFPVDDPTMTPLTGDSTIVVVNDARHQLEGNFLQRTVPYFFELTGGHATVASGGRYRWAKVAFVQTPQRFRMELSNDPLGNHAISQYDVINHGKDGIGAVSSSGQGSLWRVEALKGQRPDGKIVDDPTELDLVGKKLGFRSEMLIEDTHTSIELFRQGWRSVYVNEPGEVLAWCTHQPSSLTWRIKQVLRWHQGAVQLLLFKGIRYTSFGGYFPTMWHRLYAFDQATYYLQAIPGYVLLIMPIVYGVSGTPPFVTSLKDYFQYFTPFIVTALLPTAISSQWRKIDSHRLTRDEQTWLSTTYVQIYAFLQVVWTGLTRKSPENAWVAKVPTWPLTFVFLGQVFAVAGGVYWVVQKGFVLWYANFFSIIVVAGLAMHALWPMVSLSLGWSIPSFYYIKLFLWVFLGFSAVVLANVFSAD
ncbi:GT2 [Ectocarpus sp. CCAP 1310/34]|nr:GT2 [Ectocarpus sp. CCAP 1310/34]